MLIFTRTQALEQRARRYAHQMIDSRRDVLVAIRLSEGPVRAPLLFRSVQLSPRSPPFFRLLESHPVTLDQIWAGRVAGVPSRYRARFFRLQQFRADLGSRLAVNRRAGGNGCAALPEWGRRRIRGRAGDIDFRQQGSRSGRRVCIRMPARLRAAGSAARTTGKDGHGRRQEQRRED